MEARQIVVKARTKSENTPKLFDLLAKLSSSETPSGVGQRITKTRTRSDGKARGVAVRKKNV